MTEIADEQVARFKVTGVDVRGRRFRIFTDIPMQAYGINLYRGSVWEWTDNKWTLRKQVWN